MKIKIIKPLNLQKIIIQEFSLIWLNLEKLSSKSYIKSGLFNKLDDRFATLNIKKIIDSVNSNERSSYTHGMFIFPYTYKTILNNFEILNYLKDVAKLIKGFVFVEYWDDDTQVCQNFNIQNLLILRTSAYKSRRKKYEIIMPSWSLYKGRYLKKKYNSKKKFAFKKPYSISFCGNLNNNYFEIIKSLMVSKFLEFFYKNYKFKKRYNYHFARYIRGYSSRLIMFNKNLNFNIRKHEKFYSGIDLNDPKQRISADLLFFSNLIFSDFGLVIRGMGNFSYRLYEVMEIGCIPVIIYTDFELPLSEYSFWDNNALLIPTREISKIDEYIESFLLKNSGNANPSKIYRDYLSPYSFLSQIYNKYCNK